MLNTIQIAITKVTTQLINFDKIQDDMLIVLTEKTMYLGYLYLATAQFCHVATMEHQ